MMLDNFWIHIFLVDGLAVADITPLDFFLWGYVKDRVYQTPVQDLVTLRERIVQAIQAIDVDMLQRVWMEMEYRLDILRATNGAHVEVL